MSVSIKIEGMEQVQDILRRYPEKSEKEFQTAIRNSIFSVQREAKKRAPVGVGGGSGLRGSITTKLERLKGEAGTHLKYGIFVHEGTRPHFPPYKGAKGEPLRRWSRQKGIPPFLVARAISRKGTKAQPFLKDAVKFLEKNIINFFTNAQAKIFQ